MNKFLFQETVRKSVFLTKKMYEESLGVAKAEGLKYPDYIRYLIIQDIKRRQAPPEIPQDKVENPTVNFLSTRKRAELIRIMHEIRSLL